MSSRPPSPTPVPVRLVDAYHHQLDANLPHTNTRVWNHRYETLHRDQVDTARTPFPPTLEKQPTSISAPVGWTCYVQLYGLHGVMRTYFGSLADIAEILEGYGKGLRQEIEVQAMAGIQDLWSQAHAPVTAMHHTRVWGQIGARHEERNGLSDSQIANIPVYCYGRHVLRGDQTHCPICRQDFITGGPVAVLPCGHAFCPGCMVSALRLKRTCPMCRSVVEPLPRVRCLGSYM